MCPAVTAEAQPSAPPQNVETSKNRIRSPRGPVLIFTLREQCPARLRHEDLPNPDRYHQRLKDWLLAQT